MSACIRQVNDAVVRQQIGKRVELLRRKKKMTALVLAARTGLHRNTIYRIEAGMSLCSVVQMWRIAEALDIEIADFFDVSPPTVHF